MFWNEPNLYGYTYREVPNIPTPFFGQLPKIPFLGMTPWTTPQVPPITPFYGMNYLQTLPHLQVPFFPQIPQINPLAFYGLPYRPF